MGWRRAMEEGSGWEKEDIWEDGEGGGKEERGGGGREREVILFFLEQIAPIWECCKVENISIRKSEQIKETIYDCLADLLFLIKFVFFFLFFFRLFFNSKKNKGVNIL